MSRETSRNTIGRAGLAIGRAGLAIAAAALVLAACTASDEVALDDGGSDGDAPEAGSLGDLDLATIEVTTLLGTQVELEAPAGAIGSEPAARNASFTDAGGDATIVVGEPTFEQPPDTETTTSERWDGTLQTGVTPDGLLYAAWQPSDPGVSDGVSIVVTGTGTLSSADDPDQALDETLGSLEIETTDGEVLVRHDDTLRVTSDNVNLESSVLANSLTLGDATFEPGPAPLGPDERPTEGVLPPAVGIEDEDEQLWLAVSTTEVDPDALIDRATELFELVTLRRVG
ncbi:MAG: hypothetical protein JJT89_11155 [Nitriliruptoraceae bacterium]|nr:hypothetical protein [Nitriliruptoraceae bacterium]